MRAQLNFSPGSNYRLQKWTGTSSLFQLIFQFWQFWFDEGPCAFQCACGRSLCTRSQGDNQSACSFVRCQVRVGIISVHEATKAIINLRVPSRVA